MTVTTNQPAVIMKAFTWAYEELGIPPGEAAAILGVSENGLLQTALVGYEIHSTESALQLTFIRLYHLLYALSDGDSSRMRQWYNTFNPHLADVPRELCSDIDGIRAVNDYLETIQPQHCPPEMHFSFPRRKADRDEECVTR